MTERDMERMQALYGAEVEARWGQTPEYKASKAKKRSAAEELRIAQGAEEVFAAFAAQAAGDPASDDAHQLVGRWQAYITQHYYPCSNEVLKGLADLYDADERFQNSLNRFGAGTAAYMSRAIRAYCG